MSEDQNKLEKKEDKPDVEAHKKEALRNEDGMIEGERRESDTDGPDVEGHAWEVGRSEAERSETGKAELGRSEAARSETGKSEL